MTNGLTNDEKRLVKEQVAKELNPAKLLTFSTVGVLILGNTGAIFGLKGCIQDAAVASAETAALNYVRDQTMQVKDSIATINQEVLDLKGKSTLVAKNLQENESQVIGFQEKLTQRQLDLDNTGRQLASARQRLSSTVGVIDAFLQKATQLGQEDYTRELELLGKLLSELRSGENGKLLTAMSARIDILQLPVGSLIAWHKNLYPEASLPAGWVECNGPMPQDPESPIDMSTIPNLNGERRFLRGSTASGIVEEDTTRAPREKPFGAVGGEHSHNFLAVARVGSGPRVTETEQAETTQRIDLATTRHTHIIVGGDEETRPINMSVVWIMRVK